MSDPERRVEDILGELAVTQESMRHVKKQIDEQERLIKTLIGERIFTDYRFAIESLESQSAIARSTAVYALLHRWNIDLTGGEISKKIYSMANNDIDDEVRAVALAFLGKAHCGIEKKAMAAFFAELVISNSEPMVVRETAYRSLFQLHNLPIDEWPSLSNFQFHQDVDWKFVNEQLTDSD